MLTELDRLGTQEVVLLGGAAAVSPVVEQALQDSGRTTSRLEGPTRIDTAVAVAEAVMPGARRILLARAFGDAADPTRGFADALAAGAAAASLGSPLLLTDTSGLSEALTDYLDRTASITSVVVVGGEAAIGTAVTDALAARGLDVTRVAGEERVATAAAVTRFTLEADAGDDSPTPTGGTYVVVDGTDPLAWADGFAAAGLTDATQGGGVLLVDPTVVAQSCRRPARPSASWLPSRGRTWRGSGSTTPTPLPSRTSRHRVTTAASSCASGRASRGCVSRRSWPTGSRWS